MRVLGATLAAFVLLASPAWARTGPVQLGTALNSGGLNSPAYVDAARRYDAVTPEAVLTLGELQPSRGHFEFAFADRVVDWAVANDKPVHGTTLIWCYDGVLPSWLRSGSWSRDELIAVMRDHITTVMDHYEGRVRAWDVVNEAFASGGGRRDCLWQRVIGDAWIEIALRAARAADPSAKLFYNETAADFPNAKFGAVETMAKDFVARGVPLDGVGLQNHLLNGSAPLQFLAEDAMRRIGALGLAVHVSELDAFLSQFGGTQAEALDRQAQAFQTVAAACQAVDACFRVTMWGAADAWSWRGAEQKAVALDAGYQEKVGWWGIQEAIRPRAVPVGQPPGPAGRPIASATTNTGVFGVSWPAAWDADGDRLNYVLEHRDADDAGWAAVASGIRSLGFSFTGGRLERQGTYRYRVRASDGSAVSGYSEESLPVVVDRSDPTPPAIAPDRPADGGGWHRDRVTLSFAGTGDPALADGSAGSGVDPGTVPAPSTYTATGAHTVSGIVRDRAGNASRSATATVRVDASPPTATLSCPATVRTGEPGAATWTAGDEGSGLTGAATGTLTLDTTQAGTFTARYEAVDVSGHRTPATCTYVVEPEAEPEPTATPAAEPTSSPTATPTSSPTATPSAAPTATPIAPAPAAASPLPVRPAAPVLRRASRVGRDGRVRITLGCSLGCSGRAALLARGRTLVARRFAGPAGSVRVVLRLPARGRRALARYGRLRVRLAIAPPGRSWPLTLRRPRR